MWKFLKRNHNILLVIFAFVTLIITIWVYIFPELNKDVKLIKSDIFNLFEIGAYANELDCEFNIGDEKYYKTGCILNMSLLNNNKNAKAIKKCVFYPNNVRLNDVKLIDIIPVTYDDEIKLFAINVGNCDINYTNIFVNGKNSLDSYNNLLSKIVPFNIKKGEVKEIYSFSFAELDSVMNEQENTLYIMVKNQFVKDGECFVGNIYYDKIYGYSSAIYEGEGDSNKMPIPIFLDTNNLKSNMDIISIYPSIEGNQNIQFILLPNESCKLNFDIEIEFSDGSKIRHNYIVNIIVPTFNDNLHYAYLIEALAKNKNGIRHGDNSIILTSFLYSPDIFYTYNKLVMEKGYEEADLYMDKIRGY